MRRERERWKTLVGPCWELHRQCSVSVGGLDIIQHTYLRNIFLLELSQLPQAAADRCIAVVG